jgi:hypothetical protein
VPLGTSAGIPARGLRGTQLHDPYWYVQYGPLRPVVPPSGQFFSSAVQADPADGHRVNTHATVVRRMTVPSGHVLVSAGQVLSSNASAREGGQVFCVHSKPWVVHPQPLHPSGDWRTSPTW